MLRSLGFFMRVSLHNTGLGRQAGNEAEKGRERSVEASSGASFQHLIMAAGVFWCEYLRRNYRGSVFGLGKLKEASIVASYEARFASLYI